MKRIATILMGLCMTLTQPARADLFGGDLPLLAQIVTNTLNTLYELQKQSRLLNEELRGIEDKINRLKTVADLLRPEDWRNWRDPRETAKRLSQIYYTLPPEYRTEKSDSIEREITQALQLAGQVTDAAKNSFDSGKQLESRAEGASPGVSQKLTASGVGSLVALEAQNQVVQARVVSLLAHQLADSREREARSVTSQANEYKTISTMRGFSDKVKLPAVKP